MNRLPHVAVLFATFLLVAADKKPEKTKPSAPQIQQWIKLLGDEDYKVREEATRDLIEAGRVALEAVTKATNSKDPEVKQRALMIIKKIEKQIKKAAIAYFTKLGGHVAVDKKSPSRPVIGLSLESTKVTDDGLMHVKGLTTLQDFYLGNTQVTDAGLVHLKGLAKLKTLDLYKTKVTQGGIEKLQKALPKCYINPDELRLVPESSDVLEINLRKSGTYTIKDKQITEEQIRRIVKAHVTKHNQQVTVVIRASGDTGTSPVQKLILIFQSMGVDKISFKLLK